MRNQYPVSKPPIYTKAILFGLLLFSLFHYDTQAQSLKITATGTGQTTGHIASLTIVNTTGASIRINSQTCYIPSEGKYQPYVATIPATTIPTGTSQLRVEGYCADVFAQPVPIDNPMPLISTWIPVLTPDNVAYGGTNLLTTPAVPAFIPNDIPGLREAKGFTALPAGATQPMTTTWPNTTIPLDGTIKPASNPGAFAPVLVGAIMSITKSYDALKKDGKINTPYSSDPEKERDAIIQQTIWMYTAAITGNHYQKEQFHAHAVMQFEDNTGTTKESLTQEVLDKLTTGIDDFWNAFINVSIDAKVISGTNANVGSANAISAIPSPWDKIELTDFRMKPGKAAAGAAVFPWIPVIAGAAAAGTVIYLLADKKDDPDPVDCAFTISAMATNSTCGQSNGSITTTALPSGNYSYQWSNGASSTSLTNVPAGMYSVTITELETSCSHSVQATITDQSIDIDATITAQNTDCNQPTGSVSVTPSTPGTYTYQWSNGATTQNQSNLPAGAYTVTISAGGDCQKVLSTQVGTKPFEPTVSFNTTPSTCGDADGAATITVNPPGQYQYAWSDGQTGSSVSGLAAGAYNVTVSLPGTSCTYTTSVTIEDEAANFSVSISSTMSDCGLSNGTATATVNPPGAYTFLWSNGQTGPQATGLAGGMYTVTVSITGTNCSEEASVMVTETPPNFVVSLSSTLASCGVSDGTVTATVTPPGAYSYLWSNGQTSAQITGLASGVYSVTVTLPGDNCVQQATITVSEEPFPYAVSFNTTPASCGASDGTSTVVINPSGEVNYLWSNGQTDGQLSNVPAGTYTVTLTVPGTNCSTEATTTINESPAEFTVTTNTTSAGCGLSNGSATAMVDPPGSYTYLWSNGQTGSQLMGVMAGNYTVTVSITGTSCIQTANAVVEEIPPTFTLSFNTTPADCGVNNGSATVQVMPPGSYTFLWSNGATGPQITNVGSGDYTVTVTMTGTSCSTSGTVNVGQMGGGGFTATFETDNADCGTSSGSATITVSPPGEYTYLWSNQQTGMTLQSVGAGTYTVTATDEGGCTGSFSVTIGENEAEYVSVLSVTPGTCAGGGDIRLSLTTPGAGPLVVDVTGPEGMNMFSVPSGIYNLSAFIAVVPGAYSITVSDQQIGPSCTETVMATVNDVTPPLDLVNDFYMGQGSNPVNGNVLDNDLGLDIQMTQVDNEMGGTVTFMANGNFQFIADPGFSGEASFLYTVTDACGNTAVAEAVIFVEELPCDIDVTFDDTPASCGMEDGALTAIVSGPGEYVYVWNTGDEGPTITNIPPAEYAVTITDLDSGCTYEDVFVLEGVPGNYVEDIMVTHPTCDSDGDIQFTAISPLGNTLNMLVEYPFGAAEFDIDAGLILLSDYVTTIPGEYFIEVSDPEAGPGCSESFSVTINDPPTPVIEVIEVIPPSGPGVDDGSVFIEVPTPGMFPYAVYVNGLFAFTVSQNNFFLINLAPGVYTVYLVDINDCQSNTEEFVMPSVPESFSLGISITDASPISSNEQPNIAQPGHLWRSALTGSYRYEIGRVQQMVRVLYAPGIQTYSGESVNGFLGMEYLSGPDDLRWKGFGLRAQGGIGSYIDLGYSVTDQASSPFNWLLRGSVEYRLFKRIILSGNISMRGLDYIAPVSYEFGVRVPYFSWRKNG